MRALRVEYLLNGLYQKLNDERDYFFPINTHLEKKIEISLRDIHIFSGKLKQNTF